MLKSKPGDKLCSAKYYQHIMGSLNHLAAYTRPDIAFAVSKLAQFNANPTATHLKAAMHVLRYLKGTRNLCIVYKRQPGTVNIIGYSDADWGSDENDRISYTGYAFMVHGGPASWTAHSSRLSRIPRCTQNMWHSRMLHGKPLHEDNSFKNSTFQ
jgi:hypothetical protein